MQTLAMILRAVQDREEAADAEGATGAGGERAAYPPFLVVAPTSVLPTWLAEAARFAPSLRAQALAG